MVGWMKALRKVSSWGRSAVEIHGRDGCERADRLRSGNEMDGVQEPKRKKRNQRRKIDHGLGRCELGQTGQVYVGARPRALPFENPSQLIAGFEFSLSEFTPWRGR